MTAIKLPKGDRSIQWPRLMAFLRALNPAYDWSIEVKRLQKRRSIEQNAYLWGVVYAEICKHLPGWEVQDVHEYCLGECFGWEVMEGLGRKRMRPVKRSSKLSTMEFSAYVAFIQQRMAEHGIYIADPNEVIAA